jgi:WD40 repeat protein
MVWKHQIIEGKATEATVPFKTTCLSNDWHDELFIPKEMSVNDNKMTQQISQQENSQSNTPAKLVHVHGYQSMCLGKSAWYDGTGNVVYSVSNLVVKYDRKANHQHYFSQHEALISALCMSNTKKLVASASGSIHVWDQETGTQLVELPIVYSGHVVSYLTFSKDGTRLASISHDVDRNFAICVFVTNGAWNDGILQARSLAGHSSIYFGVFTQSHLVTGGAYHLNFWTEGQSSLIPAQQSVDDLHICALSVDEKLVTGTRSGLLVLWEDQSMYKVTKAHSGSVLTLSACPEGLVSAGSDGVVIIWSKLRQKIASFEVRSSSRSIHQRALCSLDVFPSLSGDSTTRILVGTRSSEVNEISLTTGAISVVCSNHTFGHVQDATLNPSNQTQFATVGKDETIRVWDLGSHLTLSQTTIDLPLCCIDWSSDGSTLIVGCDTQSKNSPPYTVSEADVLYLYVREMISSDTLISVPVHAIECNRPNHYPYWQRY